MCSALLPPGVNPIVANKYININNALCSILYPSVTSCLSHPHVALTTQLTTLVIGPCYQLEPKSGLVLARTCKTTFVSADPGTKIPTSSFL